MALRKTPEGGLRKTARDRATVIAALMGAVKSYSLGRISYALYDVDGGAAEYVTREPAAMRAFCCEDRARQTECAGGKVKGSVLAKKISTEEL